ncbi:hypothetical protein B5807_00415 [Epicoccum nigrum]|uniref:Uncharacterized protein n=1 Tax=Epicoccum nigrum TaxID=105696 RepID=A0A1Y2MDZ7_EPING|nr:hypothetical protein B5807_00415 [Epicoccum nigrum]
MPPPCLTSRAACNASQRGMCDLTNEHHLADCTAFGCAQNLSHLYLHPDHKQRLLLTTTPHIIGIPRRCRWFGAPTWSGWGRVDQHQPSGSTEESRFNRHNVNTCVPARIAYGTIMIGVI